VLEALACGLPVVYPASGGTPELVGEAGIGVPHPDGFDRDEPPAPEALAAAVVAALVSRDELSRSARRRAVERFPLDAWLERHAALFAELVERARRPAR
jgi:alpha-1,6-mannosyltransferase